MSNKLLAAHWEQQDEIDFIVGLGTFNDRKRAPSGDRRRALLSKYCNALIRRPAATLGHIDREACLLQAYDLR